MELKYAHTDRETGREIYEVSFARISTRHLDRVWSLKCLPHIVNLKLFPDMKEISESYAAFWAITRGLKIRPGDTGVHVVVVGDGQVPRTGALLALLSQWTVCSVDPAMQVDLGRALDIEAKLKRLSVIPTTIEAADPAKLLHRKDAQEGGPHPHTIIMLSVHSHAKMSVSARQIFLGGQPPGLSGPSDAAPYEGQARLAAVSIPCCVADDLFCRTTTNYTDNGILSPMRSVNIYDDKDLRVHLLADTAASAAT